MIQIGDLVLDLSDPVVLLGLALGGLVFVLLIMSLLSARRAAKLSEPLVYQLAQVGQRVQNLSDGQERLSGGLTHVSEAQAQSQTAMLQLMERRLAQVQEQMNENLHGSARHLPNPPGPIAIDSKFPLEAYEQLRRSETQEQLTRAAQQLRLSLRKHIKDISERYIIEGETADGALMFLPSEAVYAELHANFPEVVREGFAARVWIVSPTTCMATLNTMRAVLKDARMQEQAGAIRKELGLLYADVDRLGSRVENLDRHFGQAAKDIADIKISADKAGRRARRLDNFDFEELAKDDTVPVVQLAKPPGE